jgi:hypothetical protein
MSFPRTSFPHVLFPSRMSFSCPRIFLSDAIIASMAEEKIDELTAEQLAEKLKVALETWPLYRTLHYRGAQDYTDLPENI